MKKFTIIHNSENCRYFLHVDGPFYISVSESYGIFWLKFSDDSLHPDDGLDIEICPEIDAVSRHVIASENTDYVEMAICLIYEETQAFIVDWLDKGGDLMDADSLESLLMSRLKELAQCVAIEYPSYETYKNHVEETPHDFCRANESKQPENGEQV